MKLTVDTLLISGKSFFIAVYLSITVVYFNILSVLNFKKVIVCNLQTFKLHVYLLKCNLVSSVVF